MKQFSILGRRYGTGNVTEICQVDTHPQEVVRAAKEQNVFLGLGPRGNKLWARKWESVHYVDNVRMARRQQ
jgi:hypothetical protein